jgi:hypothetical protein
MILGIDPGLSGALVLLSHDGERVMHLADMPTTVGSQGKRSVNGPLLADRRAYIARHREALMAAGLGRFIPEADLSKTTDWPYDQY